MKDEITIGPSINLKNIEDAPSAVRTFDYESRLFLTFFTLLCDLSNTFIIFKLTHLIQ